VYEQREGVLHAHGISDTDPQWEPRELEAQLLAGLLRLSRISVLYGAVGAGKTTLLFTGVLPLLQRRDDDKLGSIGQAVRFARFPERRRRNVDSAQVELAIFFHEWNEQPLAALRKQICAALSIEHAEAEPKRALADDLATWSKEFGVRFLIVLDAFEHYLNARPDRQGIEKFAREFSQAVNTSQLGAHFLISVRDDAELLLDRFRTRIAGFDNSSFRLPPPRRVPSVQDQTTAALPLRTFEVSEPSPGRLDATPTEESMPTTALSMPSVVSPSDSESLVGSADATAYVPRLEGSPPDVLARLQGTPAHSTQRATWLSLTSYQSYLLRFARWPGLAVPAGPESERAHSAIATVRVEEPEPGAVSPTSPESNPSVITKTRREWLALPLVCAPLLLIVWATTVYSPLDDRLQRRTAVEGAETPRLTPSDSLAAPASTQGLRRIGLAIDADNATDMHIAHDLLRVIAPDAGLALVVQPGAVLFSKDSLPGLALMRYESLQTLRAIKNPAEGTIDSLRIVMPLYTEEIYFIVRRDSPLTFIHQIEGARINVGLERSSRRLTVARLYEAMFNRALPGANLTFLGDGDAFKNLVYLKTVDVVVVVAAQPAKSLSTLAPQISGSIKLLKLDPQDAASRRAIDVYLPATVRAANYRAWLPDDTSTLATMAFLVSTGGAALETESLEMFAQSLCRKLPLLRRDGHPKWREVQPGFEIDVGWAYSALAKAAFQACDANNPAGASVVRR
jgi:hypothetical protein